MPSHRSSVVRGRGFRAPEQQPQITGREIEDIGKYQTGEHAPPSLDILKAPLIISLTTEPHGRLEVIGGAR